MRLFVAVDIDDAVRTRAVTLAREVARRLARGSRHGDPIRWVAPEQLHLTLRFIGEVAGQDAEAVRSRLEAPASVEPFDIELAGVGTFPPGGPPRVVWVDVVRGARELSRLHEDIEARLRSVGVVPDNRPFRAHLTLGRFREGSRAVDLTRLQGLATESVGACRVNHATLYESRLSPKGPAYVELVRTPLAPGGSSDMRPARG